jgi:hypothetical protein
LTITVTPTTIPSGGTATVSLISRDPSGNPLTTGGWPFSFTWSAAGLLNPGSGSFSSLTDNHNGTYTATFTGTTVARPGTITISATLGGQPITSTPPTITVTPAVPATQLAISNLSATNLTAGSMVSFTVTAEDSSGAVVPTYTGTIRLTSTDNHATAGGSSLPMTYTFVAGDNGTHTCTVMLTSAGTQTITATDAADKSLTATSSPIMVSAGSLSGFAVHVVSANTLVAGEPFLVTAQAADQFGNPLASYSGPSNITIAADPPDPQANPPITATLNSSGLGVFLGDLKTAGLYRLIATAGSFSSVGTSIAVNPAPANHFAITTPSATTTGSPLNVTVTALDPFGNIATGYSGKVHFTSTDAHATLPPNSTLASGVGTFSVTLTTAGSQTIAATDTISTNPVITGTSSPINTRGLTIMAFAPTPNGFTATFSEPFNPANLMLYATGQTPQDVTLVGVHAGPISGSLILDPTNMSLTFKATSNFSSLMNDYGPPVLPDDTYTVTLVSSSGAHGFVDTLGAGLDGAGSGGHADYTTTFATHYLADKTPVLSVPDFARGPDEGHAVKVPNDTGHGIPVTLYNAAGLKDLTFTLSYNPSLLTVTGDSDGDATDPASSLTLVGGPTIIDPTHATAAFHFSDSRPQSGTVVLGNIVAVVPNSAASNYKAKEFLQLGSIVINQGAVAVAVGASGVHVNAYLGDVSGNGSIDGLDVATAFNVAQGKDTGFAAYQLLDPAIVGDVALDYSVDAGAVSDLAAYAAHLPVGVIPSIPTGLAVTPGGADPTLSLGEPSGMGRTGNPSYDGAFTIPVVLDNAAPEGSTGMIEAVLALQYDPSMLSVSSADISLGSLPSLGQSWKLSPLVDQETGRIAITLFSTTPFTDSRAGSLVNITFHVLGKQWTGAGTPRNSTVVLVHSVVLEGQEFTTQVDDAQGQLVLTLGVDQRAALVHGGRPRVAPTHYAKARSERRHSPRR